MFADQQRQKHFHGTKRSEAAYEVEAQLLSTIGIWLTVLTTGTKKLQSKWLGAFECTERSGNLAYRLRLLETLRIHNVFHDSLLKPYCDDGRALPLPPAELIDEPEWEV